MASKCADENLSDNSSNVQDTFDNYTDDKVCVYDTLINGGCIKEEPCNIEDEQVSIHNYISIKDEIIDNPTVVVQDIELIKDVKENYDICCEGCSEEYDLYCIKCPMLIRIFDSNNPNKTNRVRRTLPKNFIDICEDLSGISIVALRIIPKGVIFGPFEGLNSIKDDGVTKWTLKNKAPAYIIDPKQLNWMQHITRVDKGSHLNLTPFQCEDGLYCRSNCRINVGDKLSVCWDSPSGKEIQDIDDSYWKPWVCERLDDTYACTLCCVGYNSIRHLMIHNSRCPEKRNRTDFSKEIIQCAFCKIYLDEREYLDHHVVRCCERNSKKCVAASRSPEDTDDTEPKNRLKRSMHPDFRIYTCPECPYRAGSKVHLRKHMLTHADRSRSHFECQYCDERFDHFDLFAMHQKNEHSVRVYKCHKCMFETMNAKDIQRHLATHVDTKRFRCNACGKQFKLERSLLEHVKKLHYDKRRKYKCSKCDFETVHGGYIKKHLLIVHSGVKRFKCPRCPFRTSYEKVLGRHLRYHKEAKPIDCERYDVEFCKEVPVIPRKTYSCSKCDYRTQYKSNLNKHFASMHDRSKIFACALCPYKTTTYSNLKRHVITHNDDWPFKCDLCPQMFKRKQNLTKHARVIHSKTEKGEYKCSQCPFQSDYQTSFKLHVNSHNTSELLRCSNCDFSTHHKGTFWKHRKWHERTEKGDDKLFSGQEVLKSPDAPIICAEGNLTMHIKQRFSNIFSRGAL